MIKYLVLLLNLMTLSVNANFTDIVSDKKWIHGSANCDLNAEPAIDQLRVNSNTFILRQNKCIDVEAPFIYVLFGEHTAFIQDTGATEDPDKFPIYKTIQQLVNKWKAENSISKMDILVTHSHSHLDHRAGDAQFRNKADVTLIEANEDAIIEYFNFTNWPDAETVIDLGNRKLTVFPIPGHHDESIAVYDTQTHWLLTGDTFYPGRLYINDWKQFKSSIQKLLVFAEEHQVSALMGTHIEMTSTAGIDYAFGTTYQPEETPLPLMVSDLLLLHNTLKQMGDDADDKVLDKFIIAPVGIIQRVLGTVLGWIFA
jgi:hydroxyacylglutathione hydrolase